MASDLKTPEHEAGCTCCETARHWRGIARVQEWHWRGIARVQEYQIHDLGDTIEVAIGILKRSDDYRRGCYCSAHLTMDIVSEDWSGCLVCRLLFVLGGDDDE